MSDDICAARKLLLKLLDGSANWTKFCSWLQNFRYTVKEMNLMNEEHLSQATFASFFLCLIESKGRFIKSSALEHSDSSHNLESEEATNSNLPENDYKYDFPCLEESSSVKFTKSKRRINPTAILNQDGIIDTRSNIAQTSLQLTKVQEEKFEKLFSSRRGKENFPNNMYSKKIKNRTIETPFSEITEMEKRALDIIIDIHNVLLEGTFVPNLTAHFKFLLSIFNVISSMNDIAPHVYINIPEPYLEILNSNTHWKYFCLEIFLRQQSLLMKTDFIIRNSLSTKIMQLNNIDARLKTFAENLNYISEDTIQIRGFQENYFDEIELTSKDDLDVYSEIKKHFKEEENRWNHSSENAEMRTKLNCLLKNNSDILILYSFGNLFVESLVKSVEESGHSRSNGDQKFVQLNSRLMKPVAGKANDNNFSFKELFYKSILDFCFSECKIHIRYIKYSIYKKIKELSQESLKEYVNSIPHCKRISVLMDLKIKLTLSKFLGYIDFFNEQIGIEVSKTEEEILRCIRSETMPLSDIKEMLLSSIKTGSLTVTVPWIVQYLCMADKLCASAAYYHDIILILLSFYVSQLTVINKEESKFFGNCKLKDFYLMKMVLILPQKNWNETEVTHYSESTSIVMSEEGILFVKLWLGKLFESTMFAGNLFFRLFQLYIQKLQYIKLKGGPNTWKPCIDCTDLINQEAFSMHCNFFCKMKYWENSNPLIRNIRPILLEAENTQTPDIFTMLEKQFFQDYPDMHQLINFIIKRISTVFVTEIDDIIKKIYALCELPFPLVCFRPLFATLHGKSA